MTPQQGRGYYFQVRYLLLEREITAQHATNDTDKTRGASHMTDSRRMERVGGVLTNQTKV